METGICTKIIYIQNHWTNMSLSLYNRNSNLLWSIMRQDRENPENVYYLTLHATRAFSMHTVKKHDENYTRLAQAEFRKIKRTKTYLCHLNTSRFQRCKISLMPLNHFTANQWWDGLPVVVLSDVLLAYRTVPTTPPLHYHTTLKHTALQLTANQVTVFKQKLILYAIFPVEYFYHYKDIELFVFWKMLVTKWDIWWM